MEKKKTKAGSALAGTFWVGVWRETKKEGFVLSLGGQGLSAWGKKKKGEKHVWPQGDCQLGAPKIKKNNDPPGSLENYKGKKRVSEWEQTQ